MRKLINETTVLIAALFIMLVAVSAQQTSKEDKKDPTLTTEQKQSIQLLIKQMQNDELTIRVAQLDFERTQKELSGLLQALQVPGYTLDLQTMLYSKEIKKLP